MKKVVFVVFMAVNFLSSFAQKKVSNELCYSAISKYLESELLSKAYKRIGNTEPINYVNSYLETLKQAPSNIKANYGLALALYTDYQQPQSIYYLEEVIKQAKDSLIEANYFLGNAYHLSGKYLRAKQCYESYLSLLNSNPSYLSSENLLSSQKDVSHRIEMCQKGMVLSNNSPLIEGQVGKKLGVSMIGDMINTSADDFGAIFCSHDSLLYYTSRRIDDGDIYSSHYSGGVWQKATSVDPSINTRSYETVINASSDGNRIYFYRSGIEEGTVYYSDKKMVVGMFLPFC